MSIKKTINFLWAHIFETLIVVLTIVLSLTVKGFGSFTNIVGILRSMSMIGVLAFGTMTNQIAGEMDMSVVGTVALTGIVIGKMIAIIENSVIAFIVGVLIMIVVAIFMGTLNTFLVSKLHFPAFVATMATNYITYGFGATITQGFAVIGFPSWYKFFGGGSFFELVPVPAVILVIVFFITKYILEYTKIGRDVFAVGGNMEAARLSGIDVIRAKRFSYIYYQLCAVLAGIMVSSQVMSGLYKFGNTWDFQAISCVAIGGTPFTGGAGTVWGTLVGIFFYGLVNNTMTLLNISQFTQYIIRGLVILLAVFVNNHRLQQNKKGDE